MTDSGSYQRDSSDSISCRLVAGHPEWLVVEGLMLIRGELIWVGREKIARMHER